MEDLGTISVEMDGKIATVRASVEVGGRQHSLVCAEVDFDPRMAQYKALKEMTHQLDGYKAALAHLSQPIEVYLAINRLQIQAQNLAYNTRWPNEDN